ncbi:MAG TPA: right-handed parallel beta-helix repeat-containing protein [Casimicrobiaceae bacterium]|nr:right-handed parallel beta-helix repeat-containing protein [Casimicrobiaceae bacterium]
MHAIAAGALLFALGTSFAALPPASVVTTPPKSRAAPSEPVAAPPAEEAPRKASREVASVPPEQAIGELVHDGPATPEQISLYLPIVDERLDAQTAAVRYSDGGPWRDAHPLLRVRPDLAAENSTVHAAFAGVIVDLVPDTQYRIEVTVHGANSDAHRALTTRTRALPPSAGKADKVIKAGATGAAVQAVFDSATAGDVIEFSNGTYPVDNLVLKRHGSPKRPIYIRGESRDGVRIVDKTERVLHLVGASDVVVENLSLEGSGIDSGTAASSIGIEVWDGSIAERITVRNVTIRNVDQGIVAGGEMRGVLVYDSTLIGNDTFEKKMLESNIAWNDDGIRVPGRGHAVFNNTLSGFGDALAVSEGPENAGVHFYRNRVLFSCDDAFEGDYGMRNITFYDNRIQNAMTLASFDPLYGGPAFVFRNVAINIGRQPYKLNNTNAGMFFYNNTVVRMPGYAGGNAWAWAQPDNGPLREWGYRNNILIFSGPRLLALESSGNDPIDFAYNGWFPDATVWWTHSGGAYPSVEAAGEGLPETHPVVGTSRLRHDHDVIAEPNPFTTEIRFNASYDIPVMARYEPALAQGSVLRNAGVPIPGITDGYSGSAPDIGAVIAGRRPPIVGDRTR